MKIYLCEAVVCANEKKLVNGFSSIQQKLQAELTICSSNIASLPNKYSIYKKCLRIILLGIELLHRLEKENRRFHATWNAIFTIFIGNSHTFKTFYFLILIIHHKIHRNKSFFVSLIKCIKRFYRQNMANNVNYNVLSKTAMKQLIKIVFSGRFCKQKMIFL